MDFHGLPINSIWTAVRWLPAALLRQFFPRQRLAALQYVDLVPRGDSSTVNLGASASFDAWLNIINLSPFSVEFDRAEFEFYCAGTSIKATRSKREVIEPGQTMRFKISGPIPDRTADQMARNYRLNNELTASINGFIEYNCKLHSFCKDIYDLSEIKPRFLNVSFPEK